MPTEFKVPSIAEGVEEVEISDLYVSEGDTVEADQDVMEVGADKTSAALQAPVTGTISKVHVAVGDMVPIGAMLLTIDDAGGAPAEAKAEEESPAPADAKAEPQNGSQAEAPTASAPPATSSSFPEVGTADSIMYKPKSSSAAQTDLVRTEDASGRPPAAATPSTRRYARKLGVDLSQITGSGAGGRITEEDVQAFVRDLTNRSTVSAGTAMSAPTLPDFEQFGEVARQPMKRLMRLAADNLSYSWQTIPHVTQHDLVDITELEGGRKRFVKGIGQNGPKVTMTAVLIKACVALLKTYPKFNSSLDTANNEIVFKNYFHIGVAVDTEFGLVVPVIRDADQKTILELAAELGDISVKARDGKLQAADMQGGTFTISNLGGIGGTHFTPIVNHPEVAILGVSRSQKQLALEDGQPTERLMLPLSLSYDHRVINGADAARFMVKLNHLLSDYVGLLVEC